MVKTSTALATPDAFAFNGHLHGAAHDGDAWIELSVLERRPAVSRSMWIEHLAGDTDAANDSSAMPSSRVPQHCSHVKTS